MSQRVANAPHSRVANVPKGCICPRNVAYVPYFVLQMYPQRLLSLSLSLSRYLSFVTFAAGMVIYIKFDVYCFVSCTNSEIVVLKLKASFSKESSLILLLMWVL